MWTALVAVCIDRTHAQIALAAYSYRDSLSMEPSRLALCSRYRRNHIGKPKLTRRVRVRIVLKLIQAVSFLIARDRIGEGRSQLLPNCVIRLAADERIMSALTGTPRAKPYS